jgi:hypothetical protein
MSNFRKLLEFLLLQESHNEHNLSYQGAYRAPAKDDSSPIWYMNQNAYPDDFYSLPIAVAARYYGDGNAKNDLGVMSLIRALHNRPKAKVRIYRAVPKFRSTDMEQIDTINPGDWVTIWRHYAISHGEAVLQGKYKILSKVVPASTLYTDGNSLYEFGWNP